MRAFISALPGVFEAIEASDEVREAFVFAAWRHVAGPQMSDRTSPVAVEKRKLVVAVADKAWKRNLESLAAQLLYKLNAALGRDIIDYIEFRVLPDRVSYAETTSEGATADETSLPDELAASLATIADSELRQTVATAAATCLSRKHAFSYLNSETIN